MAFPACYGMKPVASGHSRRTLGPLLWTTGLLLCGLPVIETGVEPAAPGLKARSSPDWSSISTCHAQTDVWEHVAGPDTVSNHPLMLVARLVPHFQIVVCS